MDTQNEKKVRRIRPGRIIKISLYVCAAIVYTVFLIRIFVSCDSKITDDIYLDKSRSEKFLDLDEDIAIYNYQPVSWTSDDGTVQIKDVHYIPEYETLFLTVRHKTETYDDGEEYPFKFVIRTESESDGTKESVPEIVTDVRFGYTYARLSAEEIVSDHGEKVVYTREEFADDGTITTSEVTQIKGGTRVWLDIYDNSGEKLFTFEIAGKNEDAVNRTRIKRKNVDVVVRD